MREVPLFRNMSGFAQHTEPRVTTPGDRVKVPLLVTAGPGSSIDSRPGPVMSAVPSNVSGSWTFCPPAPPIDAAPSTVSGAARVSAPLLTPHMKPPITVTSPPDRDASVSVRSCSSVPPGTPDTCGVGWDAVGAMLTLSPFCGTCMPDQFIGSLQLDPSPDPDQLSSRIAADGAAEAAPAASEPPIRTPARAAGTNKDQCRNRNSERIGPPRT